MLSVLMMLAMPATSLYYYTYIHTGSRILDIHTIEHGVDQDPAKLTQSFKHVVQASTVLALSASNWKEEIQNNELTAGAPSHVNGQ